MDVGVLADLLQHDPEAADWMRTDLASANALLSANGLPAHTERETPLPETSRCSLGSYPYSFLHHLRRVYAHASRDPGWTLKALPEGEDPADDPVVEDETMRMHSHLLCHSDAEGFYFPIDFEEILFDESGSLPGEMLGSTHRLMKELTAIAPRLGVSLQNGELSDADAARLNAEAENEGPFWIEKIVWLSLFEAARLSLKYKAAVCFT